MHFQDHHHKMVLMAIFEITVITKKRRHFKKEKNEHFGMQNQFSSHLCKAQLIYHIYANKNLMMIWFTSNPHLFYQFLCLALIIFCSNFKRGFYKWAFELESLLRVLLWDAVAIREIIGNTTWNWLLKDR